MKDLIDNVMDVLGDRLETGCDWEDVSNCVSCFLGLNVFRNRDDWHENIETLTDEVVDNLTAHGFEIG
jgi:hypothetical protein